ncbi:sensor histidine kinase KdpD [Amycolatopsis sp. YIM 10]|uniref:sensor histidine kinase n=1 Tax=Amycolatopsis sp. YIM 10 TaxID=2653857 RepID=UPI001290393D|nr:HAMP domain-containing sensor histidine kinase [Amycolatopsis sp. YIM 10]QFU87261.1 sensor protein RstB [Amycolatopsis sp. YIM 10]
MDRSAGGATTVAQEFLHDLGHSLATLSYLVEAVRADGSLREDTRRRVDAIEQETHRLLGAVRHAMSPGDRPRTAVVDVREVLEQIVSLVSLAGETTVVLLPGKPVSLLVDESLLWRMVTNLIDNAVRAAGPGGRVEVSAGEERGVITVEVADDGPGFGAGPAGWASLGLGIVERLAEACGCGFQVMTAGSGGTRVRLAFGVHAKGGSE